MEPGGAGLRQDTNGWSIHPPASASRCGMFPIIELMSLVTKAGKSWFRVARIVPMFESGSHQQATLAPEVTHGSLSLPSALSYRSRTVPRVEPGDQYRARQPEDNESAYNKTPPG